MRADEPKPADAKPKIDPAQTRLAKEFNFKVVDASGDFRETNRKLKECILSVLAND